MNSKFQVANRFVINVQLTQQVKVPIQPPVNHVTLEQIPSKVVLNVPRVVLGHTVLDVKIVLKVNTVKAKKMTMLPLPMLPFVLVAPLAGHPKPVVPNVNLAKQEHLVM